MIVTIDGPAGSGKSTAARGLAHRLGFDYIDTGAMYRAVAHRCLESGLDPSDAESVTALAGKMLMSFDGPDLLLDGTNIGRMLRRPTISEAASQVAQIPGVREALVRQQQAMVSLGDLVTEGRDQGTVVFPDAECKFFLEASPEVRAARRQEELKARGVDIPLEETLEQIRQRDHRDRTRAISPLRPADDAVVLDSSHLNPDEVLDALASLVRGRMTD